MRLLGPFGTTWILKKAPKTSGPTFWHAGENDDCDGDDKNDNYKYDDQKTTKTSTAHLE